MVFSTPSSARLVNGEVDNEQNQQTHTTLFL